MSSLINAPGCRSDGGGGAFGAAGCGFVDDALRAPVSLPWTTQALPTAPTFDHKLHSLPPSSVNWSLGLEFYRGDKYSDAGGPSEGFEDLGATREWARRFVHWYNHDHRHSGIRYVSPAQRHAGEDIAILAARHEVYRDARDRNPARWSGRTRDWSHIDIVTLNPERESVVSAAERREDIQPKAA